MNWRQPTVVNAAILGAGCILAAITVVQLQGIGRGVAVAGDVTAQAQQAYSHLVTAGDALAQADFATSETEFARAEEMLRDTRTQLQDALASSRHVLHVIDLSGKVQSGEELLEAAETLTQAGQRLARGIAPLQSVDIVAEPAGDGKTMVDALAISFEQFSAAVDLLAKAERTLSRVSTDALPDEISANVVTLKESVPKARQALSGFLNQNQIILSVLGAERERQYLLLFENNHELRPTGGFIGSIGLVNIDRGVVENIAVQTVYDPDGQLTEFIAPPPPLRAITSRWYLRDANWFVDFSSSAREIASFFEKEGGPTVDGVIAMTPEVIKELLTVTGPIEMPAYNVTVTKENFVVLTQDQVTYAYDRVANRPKQFLSDLTPIILQRLFAQPAKNSLPILGSLSRAIAEKQLLIYFSDPNIQQRIVAAGWSGAFPKDAAGFLSVNNANIGGHKSDQFIEQEIDYRSQIETNGDVEAVVTIRRTHHGPTEKIDYNYPPTEDPAQKDNVVWQRVFVPLGAELLEARGFVTQADVPQLIDDDHPIPLTLDADLAVWQQNQRQQPDGTIIGQEAGYQYFANWQRTAPGDTSIGIYRFRIPGAVSLPGLINAAARYSMYVAKQPGDTRTTLRLELRLPPGYDIRHTLPSDGITQTTPNTVIYRGVARTDELFGVVFTKE